MCGIAGAAGKLTNSSREAVERMARAMVHRGPDGGGFWETHSPNEDYSVVFAHRRLSILDLSDSGAQPMVDLLTGNSIIFNGEIYNFREIRLDLEKKGVEFHSKSDTEVILYAFRTWGAESFSRLRGMFAFALFERSSSRLYLVRDRLGVKPLYYSVQESNGKRAIYFSSEVRALLKSSIIKGKLDPISIQSFIKYGFVHGPRTIVDEVRLLPPASFFCLNLSETIDVTPVTYWQLPSQPKHRQHNIDKAEEVLRESVKLRLVSDVPVGVFLSGGTDSSAIAAVAAQVATGPIKTFTLGFEDAAYDESNYAEKISRVLGTEHTTITLSQESFTDDVDAGLASLDQPSFDALNTFFISKAVRQSGLKVALAGTGGDELFGGYRSFSILPKIQRMNKVIPRIVRDGISSVCTSAIRSVFSGKAPPSQGFAKISDILAAGSDLARLYECFYSLFTRDFLSQLFSESGSSSAAGLASSFEPLIDMNVIGNESNALHSISNLELSHFLGQRLLRDIDTTSMSVGLEVREPLLDHVLLQEIASLDDSIRFKPIGHKSLLRHVASRSGLQESWLKQKKTGFEMPIGAWLRDEYKERVRAALLDAARVKRVGLCPKATAKLCEAFFSKHRNVYWSRPWAVFVLIDWAERQGLSV